MSWQHLLVHAAEEGSKKNPELAGWIAIAGGVIGLFIGFIPGAIAGLLLGLLIGGLIAGMTSH